ncbi:hypothetical protein Syun_030780 [Stephania yunnanensis]|uniref:Uncharacterized protein n=1 Tax=Stephania yunnanensis TaxID=152371 RepID=A0AAP0HCH2_9MAGN
MTLFLSSAINVKGPARLIAFSITFRQRNGRATSHLVFNPKRKASLKGHWQFCRSQAEAVRQISGRDQGLIAEGEAVAWNSSTPQRTLPVPMMRQRSLRGANARTNFDHLQATITTSAMGLVLLGGSGAEDFDMNKNGTLCACRKLLDAVLCLKPIYGSAKRERMGF